MTKHSTQEVGKKIKRKTNLLISDLQNKISNY